MENARVTITRQVVYDRAGRRVNRMGLVVECGAQSAITDQIVQDAFVKVQAYLEDLEHAELVAAGRMLPSDRAPFDPKG